MIYIIRSGNRRIWFSDRLFENSREISLQIRYKRSCDFPAWLNPSHAAKTLKWKIAGPIQVNKNQGWTAHLSFYIVPGEFQLISVNYNLFRPDKKKGNRRLDKPMKQTNSQISRSKYNLFSDFFAYRVNWNVWNS